MFRYYPFSGGRGSQQCVGLLASWLALCVVASVSRCDFPVSFHRRSLRVCAALSSPLFSWGLTTAVIASCRRHGAAGSCWIPGVVVTAGSSPVGMSHLGLSYVSLTIVAGSSLLAATSRPGLSPLVAVVDRPHRWIVVADLLVVAALLSS